MPGRPEGDRAFAPHCDQRILHPPGECVYCDGYPDWQELRTRWGIGFTGAPRTASLLPDPADYARPPGSTSDHRLWGGNVARDESDLLPGEWRHYPPLRLNGEDDDPEPVSEGLLERLRRWARGRTGA